MIVCLEGPSAAGKTTLAWALHSAHGAVVIPELVATDAPPPAQAEPWFSDRHAERWQDARAAAASAPFAVIDCDPLKGLWYNGMHAHVGWPPIDVVEPLYRARIERGVLAFPDLYIYLDATEAQLRQRRADDPTRQRRGFAKNLATVGPQRAYFSALADADPGRVAMLDTTTRASLVDRVMELVDAPRPVRADDLTLLTTMARWVRDHLTPGTDAISGI